MNWIYSGVSLLSAGLARNRTLKKLDLENKGISLEGCVSLSQVLSNSECGIEQLILSRNSLTDDSIKALLDQVAIWVLKTIQENERDDLNILWYLFVFFVCFFGFIGCSIASFVRSLTEQSLLKRGRCTVDLAQLSNMYDTRAHVGQ